MKPREAFRKETLFGNRGLSQINFRLILDSHPTPSPDAKWDLKMENRSGQVIYVSTKMTGNHQGRFLCGNRKEQAVETEYFPRRPRILPTTSRFPSHSSEPHAHEEDELGRGRSRIALPPCPRGPSQSSLLSDCDRAAPESHDEKLISVPKMQQDQRSWALCIGLGFENTLQKPVTVWRVGVGARQRLSGGGIVFSVLGARGQAWGSSKSAPVPQPDLPLSAHL